MELSRGDRSLGTFLGVQAGLAMGAIAKLGSEEQKRHWLPPLARVEKLGAFALTEPEHGSDFGRARDDGAPAGRRVRDRRRQALDRKRLRADVVVVWARDTEDGPVKGFLVELPQGYEATVIEGKVPCGRSGTPTSCSMASGFPRRTCSPGWLQGHGPSSRADAHHMRYTALGRRSRLRRRAHLHAVARAVRQAARELPVVQEKLVGCSPRSPRCGSTA